MKIDWKLIGKSVGTFLRRRSPEILTGIGIASMGVSIVLAVRATPKAVKKLQEDGKETHKPLETVKLTWKYYIPSVISFAAGASCVIFASHTNLRRNAALAAACTTTENMFREYKEATKEIVGKQKEEMIHDQTSKNMVNHATQTTTDLKGSDNPRCVKFYDPYTSRYFYYDIDKLKRAILDISYQLRNDVWVTYNEFYAEIDQPSCRFGEAKGWSAEDGSLEDNFSSTLDEDGVCCMVLDFNHPPKTLPFYS